LRNRDEDAPDDDKQDNDGRSTVHSTIRIRKDPEPVDEDSCQDGAHSSRVREQSRRQSRAGEDVLEDGQADACDNGEEPGVQWLQGQQLPRLVNKCSEPVVEDSSGPTATEESPGPGSFVEATDDHQRGDFQEGSSPEDDARPGDRGGQVVSDEQRRHSDGCDVRCLQEDEGCDDCPTRPSAQLLEQARTNGVVMPEVRDASAQEQQCRNYIDQAGSSK